MEIDVRPNVLIVLGEDEARELDRFTKHSYISGTTFPALTRLLDRVSVYVAALDKETPDGTTVSR